MYLKTDILHLWNFRQKAGEILQIWAWVVRAHRKVSFHMWPANKILSWVGKSALIFHWLTKQLSKTIRLSQSYRGHLRSVIHNHRYHWRRFFQLIQLKQMKQMQIWSSHRVEVAELTHLSITHYHLITMKQKDS